MVSLLSLLGIVLLVIFLYFFLIFIMAVISASFPRRDVDDIPDWGLVQDLRIPTVGGKSIELWVVYPDSMRQNPQVQHAMNDGEPYRHEKAVIITHGWGRNRGRMVSRARHWNELNFTTILISVRDHGNSDKLRTGMSIFRFSQDINATINWWNQPVLVNGHSIGAGATILVASQNPLVRGLIAEASPLEVPGDFSNIYRPLFKNLTPFLLPGLKASVLLYFFGLEKKQYSPLHAAPGITVPTLLIYGDVDETFPPTHGQKLSEAIAGSSYVVLDHTHHSNIPKHRNYGMILSNFLDTKFS